jgi:CDP-glycerol glycerophosphotransferase
MGGNSYGDSVKGLSDYISENHENSEVIWAFSKNYYGKVDCHHKKVFFGSLKYYYYVISSKYYISNCYAPFMIIKRNGQVVLQTWHGTALKRIGLDTVDTNDHTKFENLIRPDVKREGNKQTDIFISGSAFMTEVYHRALDYSKEISLTGTPRTDVFFNNRKEIIEKVKRSFGIADGNKIILYAPTFRPGGSFEYYDLDLSSIKDYFSQKEDCEYVIMVRLHPNIAVKSDNLRKFLSYHYIDASFYPDMQDLLCSTDVLVTDYSSVMFDFMFTYQPVILYTPDKDIYNRGFYFDLDSLPFVKINSNKEIYTKLSQYESINYKDKVISFCKQNGFVEDGHATERVYNLLMSK